MEAEIKSLNAGSVYKLLFVGATLVMVPFATLLGVFALFGAETVTFNEQALVGWKGLLGAPLIGLASALGFSVLNGTLVVVGLWVYSKFRTLTIEYEMPDPELD